LWAHKTAKIQLKETFMARIFIDGFETGDSGCWDGNYGVITYPAAATGMSGSYCMTTPWNSAYAAFLTKNVDATGTIFISFRILPTYNNPSYSPIIVRFLNSTTTLMDFVIDVTSRLISMKRAGTTTIATGTAVLTSGFNKHIEIKYVPHTSAGIVQVKVNDILDIDFTGNTTPSATTADVIRFGNNNILGGLTYLDDIVLDDANWIGSSRIAPVLPTGAGNSTLWTPSVGSNWENVDEVPPSDSDYNSTDGVDNLDLYTASNLPGEAVVVKSVQVSSRIYKEVSSTPQNVAMVVRTGGVDYFSDDIEVPDTVGVNVNAIWETNPDTASAWTTSDVDALEIGLKAKT
jgi:hypothetical protein